MDSSSLSIKVCYYVVKFRETFCRASLECEIELKTQRDLVQSFPPKPLSGVEFLRGLLSCYAWLVRKSQVELELVY